ncbi:hypothetical protein L2D08_04975 [Domibacillus sp. PGB-M46]|uniref:hypothetical protein n=1 Tax=Domibacillus sp. PGB-M46 TaxID=2910255 RepID=UPI001F57B446|nr:hypothetical protein [Domibacillus sp. PGB-M46]MCI2253712.1 hypothetical protein [Domibacillus sp. PGB-M46]
MHTLIIGGGIGGLTTAVILAQTRHNTWRCSKLLLYGADAPENSSGGMLFSRWV